MLIIIIIIIIIAQIVPVSAIGGPFHVRNVVSHFLLIGPPSLGFRLLVCLNILFVLMLNVPCPNLSISHFSKEPCFLLLGNGIWALGLVEILCSTNISSLPPFHGNSACTVVGSLTKAAYCTSSSVSPVVLAYKPHSLELTGQNSVWPVRSADCIQLSPGKTLWCT